MHLSSDIGGRIKVFGMGSWSQYRPRRLVPSPPFPTEVAIDKKGEGGELRVVNKCRQFHPVLNSVGIPSN